MSTTSLASNRPTVERRHRYDREYYLTHKTLWAEKGRRWEERCAADPSCRSRRAERHRQSKARHKGRNVERRRIQQKAANQRRRARIVQTVPLEERRRIAAARKKAVYDNKRGVIKALRRASVCSVCGGPCQHFHHLQPAEKAFKLASAGLRSYRAIVVEAGKCTCLCSEHHRAVHSDKLCLVDPPVCVVTRGMVPDSAPASLLATLPEDSHD